MSTNSECDVKYIPYKEFIKQKRLEYYNKNKEEIKQKAKDKYNSLSPEEKKKRQKYRKEMFKKLPIEKKEQLREKHREYQKNRYHKLMVAVKKSSMKCSDPLQPNFMIN